MEREEERVREREEERDSEREKGIEQKIKNRNLKPDFLLFLFFFSSLVASIWPYSSIFSFS